MDRQQLSRPPDKYLNELKIDTPVNPALGNTHFNLIFLYAFLFPNQDPYRKDRFARLTAVQRLYNSAYWRYINMTITITIASSVVQYLKLEP